MAKWPMKNYPVFSAVSRKLATALLSPIITSLWDLGGFPQGIFLLYFYCDAFTAYFP